MLVPCGVLSAQSTGAVYKEGNALIWNESFQGSSNVLGQVMKLDNTLGYSFNRYLALEGGLPIYFVHASSTAAASGARSGNGLGNLYADMRLTLTNPLINYQSTLTGTAPTGDRDKGFSTGRATFDWNNHFDRNLGPLRPFADLGVANTVSDTQFFLRPFTSLGLVGHFEGGATFRLIPGVRVGASLYDILPSGEQKVYSKLIHRGTPAVAKGSGRHHGGVFEASSVSVGGVGLVRDNGFAAWASASPIRYITLSAGYTRSVVYDLNTFSFGVGLNLSPVLKAARHL